MRWWCVASRESLDNSWGEYGGGELGDDSEREREGALLVESIE